jgi:inorganic pyrophosphatase
MNLEHIEAGHDVPNDINVIIEIPSHGDPIKYEVDKKSGMVMVDRFVGTSMHYPCDYGFVPHTLSEDGDPIDVLVVSPYSLIPGAMIRCRPVGAFNMTDESGPDIKILAVPITKLTPRYQSVQQPEDLGVDFLATIEHFFQHYKDLENGKWVKVEGWKNADVAKKEIVASIKRYQKEMV